MQAIFLDTHIVIWLREKRRSSFSKKAIELINTVDRLVISPIVALELKFLFEIDKIMDTPQNILNDLNYMINLVVDEVDFYGVVKYSYSLDWTRDPFDRLIVANAIAKNSKLLTRDTLILENFKDAVW